MSTKPVDKIVDNYGKAPANPDESRLSGPEPIFAAFKNLNVINGLSRCHWHIVAAAQQTRRLPIFVHKSSVLCRFFAP
jgi:hypothetical protein